MYEALVILGAFGLCVGIVALAHRCDRWLGGDISGHMEPKSGRK